MKIEDLAKNPEVTKALSNFVVRLLDANEKIIEAGIKTGNVNGAEGLLHSMV